jgi:SAM-dependent methyltransferase
MISNITNEKIPVQITTLTTMDFKDNFSKQSGIYARFRPQYPPELYTYLASLTTQHETAWDCGTGNGQAAIGLAELYQHIIATDPSEQQIANAFSHPNITYKVEKAEETSIPDHSIDLVTVANALHWFDFEAFYKEVRRTLKPNGIIAAWAYQNPSISPELDSIITKLHDEILGNYWLTENRYVEKAYTTIPFPFKEIESPQFYSEKTMDLNDFVGFLNTWSATQRFIRQNNTNPVDMLYEELLNSWGVIDHKKTISWKLILKVGVV